MNRCTVLTQPPKDFAPKVAVAVCYLEHEGKLLLLRRSGNEAFWAVPGGKMEKDESPLQAVIRELKEEIDIDVVASELQPLGCLYFRKPEIDFPFHMFRLVLSKRPEIRLNSEHNDFIWATTYEIEKLSLIPGGRATYLRYCQALPGAKKRATASVSSYLILRRDDEILLGLRKNTGYCDGLWSFPAGHAEEGEPASDAMAREAEEELGIQIDPTHLQAVHVMHRQSNRWNIDIFFTCTKWKGEITNKEPEKCEKLSFFPLSALPNNLVEYNSQVLNHLNSGNFYSESGWI